MKTILSAVVALTLSASACATNYKWTPIAEARGNPNQPVIGVDYSRSFGFTNNSISGHGTPTVFWNDYTRGDWTSVERPKNHPMTIYRTKIDCKNRMVYNQYTSNVEVKSFYDQKPEIYESPWSGRSEWYVPDPGSAHEFVMNWACGFKNP